MSEYESFIEPNPGGDTSCPYEYSDGEVRKYEDHLEVVANPNLRHVWINSIGANRFENQFPNDKNITLSQYRYSAEFRLNVLPDANPLQIENGEVVQSMLQIWDGKGEIFYDEVEGEATGETYEFAFIWIINPWGYNYSQVFLYTGKPFHTYYTGITLPPDLNWHKYELVVDYSTRKYISFKIDDLESNDISDLDVAIVDHPEWLGDTRLLFSITAEVESAYPNATCGLIFTYSAEFRNAVLERRNDGDDNNNDDEHNSSSQVGAFLELRSEHFLDFVNVITFFYFLFLLI